METMTDARMSTATTSSEVARSAAFVGAAAFMIAAVWFGLASHGVTVSSEPTPGAGVPLEERQRMFFAWFVTTLHQERLYTSIAIIGFVCLAIVAVFVHGSLGRERPLVTLATFVTVLGAGLWIVGNIAQLGAHRAAGLLSTHGYSTETVSAVMFTADMVDDAFEVLAFTALGFGLLAFAGTSMHSGLGRRGWTGITFTLGMASLMLVISYLADVGDLTDVLLVAIGGALLPVWLALSGWRIAKQGSEA